VNIVLKEGKNKFHGSGWWFGQRSAMDATSFFRNKFSIPNPDHARDQYGFSLGGPSRRRRLSSLWILKRRGRTIREH